ncbi:CAP domain-containing protein [Strongyloides ratti]|nr:CAP domain-containing protein [Strongyloides ratti]CEF65115.1 CAP domain-containing protein [Strongyloides ratti]
MTSYLRDYVVWYHNQKRLSLSTKNTCLPIAKKLNELTYDCNLENTAVNASMSCKLELYDDDEIGENLYMGNNALDYIYNVNDALERWWTQHINLESIYFNHTHNILNFGQMAWADSLRVGCAVKTCNTKTLFICHYQPRGNIVGEPIYNIETQCSNGTNCKSFNGNFCNNITGYC